MDRSDVNNFAIKKLLKYEATGCVDLISDQGAGINDYVFSLVFLYYLLLANSGTSQLCHYHAVGMVSLHFIGGLQKFALFKIYITKGFRYVR